MFTNTMFTRQDQTNHAVSGELAFEGIELTDTELESVAGGAGPYMPSMPSASEMLNMLNATLQNVPLLSIR
ncbi:MAG TPA: hypothetical protein VKR06_20380 [Ktedonosporobacter sp.]|nr:hypothetical protein [Ktedonosporobacter sp.]